MLFFGRQFSSQEVQMFVALPPVTYSRICSWPSQPSYSPINTRDDGRGKTFRSYPKHVSLCHCMTFFFHWSPFVGCLIYNRPEVKFIYSSNHTEHHHGKYAFCFTRTKHDCTIAIHWSLVTNKRRSAVGSANNFQGQLQISQSVTLSIVSMRH